MKKRGRGEGRAEALTQIWSRKEEKQEEEEEASINRVEEEI